jgi:hypothetical protein
MNPHHPYTWSWSWLLPPSILTQSAMIMGYCITLVFAVDIVDVAWCMAIFCERDLLLVALYETYTHIFSLRRLGLDKPSSFRPHWLLEYHDSGCYNLPDVTLWLYQYHVARLKSKILSRYSHDLISTIGKFAEVISGSMFSYLKTCCKYLDKILLLRSSCSTWCWYVPLILPLWSSRTKQIQNATFLLLVGSFAPFVGACMWANAVGRWSLCRSWSLSDVAWSKLWTQFGHSKPLCRTVCSKCVCLMLRLFTLLSASDMKGRISVSLLLSKWSSRFGGIFHQRRQSGLQIRS